MSTWPRTDLHIHATQYRLQGARPEMTVRNVARQLEGDGYAAAGIVEHLDTNPKHPLSCLEAMVAEFRLLSGSRSGTPALFVGA
jgi:hypothetical protein